MALSEQSKPPSEWINVADVGTLREKGVVVVTGRHRRIAVFADGEAIHAVENNCPHMGFPLDRGSVQGGILTCHWHQARFDLRSGCTFDLWADDVARYETVVVDDTVYVAPDPVLAPDANYHRTRLMRAIEQDVGLVQAKALLALLDNDEPLEHLIVPVVQFASRNLSTVSEGLIRLGCVVRLFPHLNANTAYLALYYAIRKIANETSRSMARRERQPLAAEQHEGDVLKTWLRQWVTTRHRDGCERTLLTALNNLQGGPLADLVFGGATERLYANGGHHMEDCNKVFELAEIANEIDPRELLPLLVAGMTGARGEEESTNWHHPIEIVAPLRAIDADLPDLLAVDRNPDWVATPEFRELLLGDDPLAILEGLSRALGAGAPPVTVAREVALAAASRLARFATSNEVTDWFNPQHTFVFTNAAYQAVQRAATPDVVRAIYQGAISVYMDRFLNVPAARPPRQQAISSLPEDAAALLEMLLTELDQRGNIETLAAIVVRYLRQGCDITHLIDQLTLATVREDLDFHSLQVLEAAVNQCSAWSFDRTCEVILVGVVRNLAAHCPTRRAGQQTADIARRLHQGERIFEAEAPAA